VVAVELIPREVLFGNPERALGSISPDGTRVGFVAPVDGVLNLWVGPLHGEAHPVTEDRGRGVLAYFFSADSRHALYLQDREGDENWRLYAVGLDSGQVRDLTPYDGVQARVLAMPRRRPSLVAVGLNRDDPAHHDVYLVDLDRQHGPELVMKNPGFNHPWAPFVIDDDAVVRAGLRSAPDGTVELCVPHDLTHWRVLLSVSPEDSLSLRPLDATVDGSGLYLLTASNAQTAHLARLDLESGRDEVLAKDPDYDVATAVSHPVTRAPQIVAILRDRLELAALDRSLEDDLAMLHDADPGDLYGLQRDDSDSCWLATFVADDGPARTYLYERDRGKISLLFKSRSDLDPYRLASMEPFSFRARDGLTIHGYLSFPPGEARRGLPAVLLVHGGPWGRDVWCFDPTAQWLANRGYLCVQVNFRGSAGYGRAFLNAGDREWGGKMHADLLDAVDWVVGRGYADPRRVGVFGASFGGYAALVAATFSPEVFACAVEICGPVNLQTFIESAPPYWEALTRELRRRVGDPDTEPEFLWSRSPLSRAAELRVPLLIGHGANDPRVKQSESEQLVAALEAKGIACEYLVFPDEGHGFVRPENRLRFYRAAEQFLSRHLHGRCDP
jgi:dipeptidyl aminopeptidase/acylaminoacyl peptidase